MWLTLATFVGYAVVYTVILKPVTPQNIVIGGASGAMPPVLGWAAVNGRRHLRRARALPHHLRVDAAAFLGARALSQARTTRRPASRCCRSRMATRSPGCTCFSTRSFSWRARCCRSRSRMSGAHLSGCGASCWAVYSCGTRSRIYTDYSDALARRTFRYLHLLSGAAVRGIAGRPLRPSSASERLAALTLALALGAAA